MMKVISIFLSTLFFISCLQGANAQVLDSLLGKSATDTTILTNKDAIYNRPFVTQANMGRSSTALGGYLEANTNYAATNGVSDGFSMEMRRFNLFVYSTVGKNIKLLSEIEFEHGTKEINIETAILDFELDAAFTIRAGILLPPIGYFNQNHDGPKWDFVDRPLVSTNVIPSTLSEVGFGFHGKVAASSNDVITYELYLVNGLRDEVIGNVDNRTNLQAGKSGDMFAQDNNGSPMLTSRMAFKNRKIGEFGLSYYGGIYNTFQLEGMEIDAKRYLHLLAVDFNVQLGKLALRGEAAKVNVHVPSTYTQQYGTQQFGMHIDAVYPVKEISWKNWDQIQFNALLRGEWVDYNLDKFYETGSKIGDEIASIVAGLSCRIETNTVFRFNYRFKSQRDLLFNAPDLMGGWQFGIASYF